MAVRLFVGLGNPGEKYSGNRHNAGFMAVDAIAEAHGFGPWKKRFQGLTAEAQIGGHRVVLLKPMTYMNESGRAVNEAARFYKLLPGDITVFHDELDLEPGKVKVKTGGGHAGHNGLRSIAAHIGSEFVRVRIGIGHPGHKAAVSNYVLADFAKADRDWLMALLPAIAKGAPKLADGTEASFMNEVARLARPHLQPKIKPADNGSAPAKAAKPATGGAAATNAADAVIAAAAVAQRSTRPGGLSGWLYRRIRGGAAV